MQQLIFADTTPRVLWRGSNGDRLVLDGTHEVYHYEGRADRRPVLEDGSVLLSSGPHGRTRKRRPGVVTTSNPLIFDCAYCGRSTTAEEPAHPEDCPHPGNAA